MPNPVDAVMFVLLAWGVIEHWGDFHGESNVI